jgi:hypothetical protein
MSAKSLTVVAGLAVLWAIGTVPDALAQAPPQTQGQRTHASHVPVSHPHIEVTPRPLLYRRCKDWYVLQHRPSGTVLFPQTHCWWVRG